MSKFLPWMTSRLLVWRCFCPAAFAQWNYHTLWPRMVSVGAIGAGVWATMAAAISDAAGENSGTMQSFGVFMNF
jgi:hypothetical protein